MRRIADGCRNGVEFRALADIGRRNTGTTITAGQMKLLHSPGAPIRIFAGGNTVADVAPATVPAKDVITEASIVVKSRGHVGFTYYDRPFTHKSELWSYTITRPDVYQKFVYYFLLTMISELQERARAKSVKLPQLSVRDTDQLRIPVPPLDVQMKVVEILDEFTESEAELEAELGAELEARRWQYAHYRESVLRGAATGASWSTLGEVATNRDSQRRPVTKAARVAGDIPYYGASGVVDRVRDHIFDGDFLLVSEDGANLLARSTPIAFSISGKSWVNNHAHVLEFASHTERRFAEIYLNSIDLAPYVAGGAQPKLNQANLNRIPLPALAVREQERIVAILDRFDALVNDLSIDLPAELRARRQQYEYYRDRLLKFDQAAV